MLPHEAPSRPASELRDGLYVCPRCRRAWEAAVSASGTFWAWCPVCSLKEADFDRLAPKAAKHWQTVRARVADPPAPLPREWLTMREVEQLTGVSFATQKRERVRGHLRYNRVGHKAYHHVDWVREWMEHRARGGSGQAASKKRKEDNG